LTAVDNGKTAIDAAESIEAVNTALATAKTAIDSIKTKSEYEAEEAAKALADAKVAAKSELESYKSLDGLSDEQKSEVAGKVAAGKEAIDNATTTDAVAQALANAKTALDAITPAPAKTGCAGSVISTFFGMLVLAASALVLRKKKEFNK
jgi:LPXTG-motif cell wall-anchored protein